MTKRSAARSDGDDIFTEFDHLFEDIRRHLDQMWARSGTTPESMPLSYAYQVEIGPDGERHVTERFVDTEVNERTEENALEPLVDVWERGDMVTVLMQLPGVSQQDVALEVVGDVLTIRVDNASLRFEREVGLPCAVKPESAQAVCRNGVLEVTLSKPAPKRRRGRQVKVP